MSSQPKTKRLVLALRVIMLIVAVVCAVIFVPWDIVKVWLTPVPDTVQEQVDAAIGHGLDGIIVYVDKAGEAPERYAAGWKDRANRVLADPNALFKIASISKLYIAVAAAKVISAGHLSLEDTLAELLPDLTGRIENAEQITLRMLLQHRSGIPNFTDHAAFDWSRSHTDISESLELVLDTPADFNPDARYQYSNTNYLLIGRILDNTLGYSHHRYIQEEIVAPLGLTQTYGVLSEVDLEDVVSGYHTGYDGDLKEQGYVIPGGSMVATVQDVGVFLRALVDGLLLREDEQAIYTSVYWYEHTGLLPGYQSIARYHEDMDAVVVAFVNTSGGNMWTIAEMVYSRIVGIVSE